MAVRRHWLRALVVASAVLFASCGGDGDGGGDEAPSPRSARTEDGTVRSIRVDEPLPAAVSDDPGAQARYFLDAHAEAFGLDDVDMDLKESGRTDKSTGGEVVTFERVHGDLPVFGSYLKVHIDADDRITFVSARVPADLSAVSASPSITEMDAILQAQADVTDPLVGETTLGVLCPSLFSAPDTTCHLAYEVSLKEGAAVGFPIRYVSADDGSVLLGWDRLTTERQRETYDAMNLEDTADIRDMATLLITEDEPMGVEGATPDEDAQQAHRYAGEIYDYYADTFDRDGFDDSGSPLVSYVHVGMCGNQAFWWDDAMWFMDGYVHFDVFGHELTHGVVEHTAALEYVNESGALNESYADTMAAFMSDGGGKWEIGEGLADGPVRDLADPTRVGCLPFATEDISDACRMDLTNACGIKPECEMFVDKQPCPRHTDDQYGGDADEGGVHINSSIVNHAAYLLTEGGTHADSDIEVSGIGQAKAEQIFYKALAEFLGSTSDFDDMRDAVGQAAAELAAAKSHGITPEDCGAALNAFAAVGIGPTDADEDCWDDEEDNCPDVFNPGQRAEACGEEDGLSGCGSATSCGQCVDRSGCGWCDGTDTCVEGGLFGPEEDGACGDEDWDYFGFACDTTEARCMASGCGNCVTLEGCGWCEESKRCLEGDESGPTSGSCGEWITESEPSMSSDGGTGGLDGGVGSADGGASVCPSEMMCASPFSPCTMDSQCCDGSEGPGICVLNSCAIDDGCDKLLDSCDAGTDSCCGLLACRPMDAAGDLRCCARQTDPCDGDGECCGAMTCEGGTCQCREIGESCVSTGNCCGGGLCNEDTGRCE